MILIAATHAYETAVELEADGWDYAAHIVTSGYQVYTMQWARVEWPQPIEAPVILEARTIDESDARRLLAAGWIKVREQGSEIVLRWPTESLWPGDPRPQPAPHPVSRSGHNGRA